MECSCSFCKIHHCNKKRQKWIILQSWIIWPSDNTKQGKYKEGKESGKQWRMIILKDSDLYGEKGNLNQETHSKF